MRKLAVLVVALVVGACQRQPAVESPAPATPAPSPTPPPGARTIMSADQLLEAMRDRYARAWYRTLTFVQRSSYMRADGTPSRVETWYEAAELPGRLRIDLGDIARGNGVLYRGDSAYTIQNGQITDRRLDRNPLLVLGFDVYAQPVPRTMEQLRGEHIDLSVLHTDTLYGRPVYVVGAGPSDTTTNQFWVDAERLVFVRLIETNPERKTTRDIRFEKYVQHGGGWVAEEVRMLAAGKEIFREEYSNVRVNVSLDENLFIPERWSSAKHWYKP